MPDSDDTGFVVPEGPGILTKNQRNYLLGLTEPESDTERVIRNRIRDRVLGAVRDFMILETGLSEDDHEKIFEKGLGEDISPGGGYTSPTGEDTRRSFDFFMGVRYGFSFFFEGMRKSGNDIEDMESLLENAISDAETPGGNWIDPQEPESTTIKADVSIELEESHSIQRLYKQLREGRNLSDEELGKLVRAGQLSQEDLEEIYRREQQQFKGELDQLAEGSTDPGDSDDS